MQRALRAAIEAPTDDRSRWDWFGLACSCGLPPGECKIHPRAREAQSPPEKAWGTWMVLAGRGFGKTRTGAEWVRRIAFLHPGCRIALVAPTVADVRDTIVEGESGILAISPPWFTPEYVPSKRKLTWPNGSRATTYSAEEPKRLRGPQHHYAWADELAAWSRPETYDMLLFGLRLGEKPQLCITTTPKATPLVKRLIAEEAVVKTGGSTYDNRQHLSPAFFTDVVTSYEGTRLGRQEIHAEMLELVEAVWFASFESATHVSERYAEYIEGLPVHLAIDCGTSQYTGAVWFQVIKVNANTHRVIVFGDYFSAGSYSAKTAEAISQRSNELPSKGIADVVRLDPASKAHTGIGVAAYHEYERVFGDKKTSKWPSHQVVDGLDLMEIMLEKGCLLIHPRCTHLIDAFKNYRREEKQGIVFNKPADPQNPHEDMMDALRGGIRDVFPEGRGAERNFSYRPARNVF
jgi:phage terminase large subunit-like protein